MQIISKKKRIEKKRKQLESLIKTMLYGGGALGVTELFRMGVDCPIASLYERMDKLIERDKSRPIEQRLIVVHKTEDRVATRYCLTERGKKMGYWLAKRNRNANQ
ncbi:hypothetical protein RB981_003738 [Vibrio cholerae]|uniref:hypothetical protein n=1 Tax=Gammaproteobacteria TaxID=1236 RepID=UPI0010FE6ADF|nr:MULTISPECIES: hypothetical protein [Gammaproteobacteria]EKF9201251.1 hypothetical protein [Vibrio cholerae]ELE7142917.1 hypothetical protein [Vibrio cholerae]MCO4191425.1 hypothetical protein [Proteus terrae]TLE26686.1 hypothetical protein D2927_18580 [Vibrio cholerae]TLE29199.1 hypothetical protein D2928_18830 [Vibrio cholerae]